MREQDVSLQQFGEFLLKASLVHPKAAPHCVRWVRLFLMRPAGPAPLADQARAFVEELERSGRWQDWQVRQAEQAIRIYFVNFLHRTDWHRQRSATLVDGDGRVTRPWRRSRRFDSDCERATTRTEPSRVMSIGFGASSTISPIDRARRGPASMARPFRIFLTHLAVHRRVSCSTQNQAGCATLFLCRDVIGLEVERLCDVVKAGRGTHLPVVLSVPETAALLDALDGTPWLMAALVYGGGLRVSECCALRVKDLDFDQGLVVDRAGKGNKDRRCWPRDAETRSEPTCRRLSASTAPTARRTWPECGCRTRSNGSTPQPAGNSGGSGSSPARRSPPTRARASCAATILHESVIQKAVKAAAVAARIHKPASVHTLRHSFATHLLLNGVDIRQIQDYLGRAHVETTMIYAHVVKELRTPATSPLDLLQRQNRQGG